jgi:hypothetical protein
VSPSEELEDDRLGAIKARDRNDESHRDVLLQFGWEKAYEYLFFMLLQRRGDRFGVVLERL